MLYIKETFIKLKSVIAVLILGLAFHFGDRNCPIGWPVLQPAWKPTGANRIS